MKWLLVLSVLIGDFLNVKKKWQGFIFWILTDSILSYTNCQQGEYAEAAVFALYVVFAFYGIYLWKVKGLLSK